MSKQCYVTQNYKATLADAYQTLSSSEHDMATFSEILTKYPNLLVLFSLCAPCQSDRPATCPIRKTSQVCRCFKGKNTFCVFFVGEG